MLRDAQGTEMMRWGSSLLGLTLSGVLFCSARAHPAWDFIHGISCCPSDGDGDFSLAVLALVLYLALLTLWGKWDKGDGMTKKPLCCAGR